MDIGGTFTDLVLDVGGNRLTRKVLTTSRRRRRACSTACESDSRRRPVCMSPTVDVFVHGTTLATNAIIERLAAA